MTGRKRQEDFRFRFLKAVRILIGLTRAARENNVLVFNQHARIERSCERTGRGGFDHAHGAPHLKSLRGACPRSVRIL